MACKSISGFINLLYFYYIRRKKTAKNISHALTLSLVSATAFCAAVIFVKSLSNVSDKGRSILGWP